MYRVLLLVISLLFWQPGNCQDAQRIAQTNEITYLGLDFTHLRVVGETKVGGEIVHRFFPTWNSLVASERDKYDFAGTFRMSDVHYDLDMIGEMNKQTDPDAVVKQEPHEITADELVSHVQSYTTAGPGVGLVFIVENFDKFEEEGTMWVTFFDMETKQILLAKKMSGKPGGFGFRNYWARTVYEVLKDSQKRYRKWLKE